MADRPPRLDNQAYSMGRGIGETLRGPSLTSDEKYRDFLSESEFYTERFDKRVTKEQGYYALMNEKERVEHLAVLEVVNVGNLKRETPGGQPQNLETLSSANEIKRLSVPDSKTIYNIPGARFAIELLVRFYENNTVLGQRDVSDPQRADITLKNANGRDELQLCRQRIRSMIKNDVKNGYKLRKTDLNEDELEIKARVAEQAACAFLDAGNYFEGNDSAYNEVGRTREQGCFNEDLLVVAIKISMNPLDQLLNTFGKSWNEVTPYGKAGLWAYNQIVAANNNRPLNNIKNVRFVSDENSKKDYWRIEDGGETIYIPRVYLPATVGSVFDETKVGGRSLIDYIRKGEEIPWDQVRGNMWSDYASKLGKAQKIIDLYQGKYNIQLGDEQKSKDWITLANDTLSKFSLRQANWLKRWFFYCSAGFDENSKLPRIASKRDKRGYNLDLVEGGYLSSSDLFFPWDRP